MCAWWTRDLHLAYNYIQIEREDIRQERYYSSAFAAAFALGAK